MPLPKSLRTAFPAAKTLYDILGVPSTSTPGELKKAYYKCALKYHPDKQQQQGAAVGGGSSAEDPALATARFQALGVAHGILSDAARRKEYDETGEVDSEGGGSGSGSASLDSAYSHFRAQFPGFSTANIDAFAARYRGGEEELEDLCEAYTQCKGSMDGILECVPCCRDEDEERFAAALHTALASGRVQPFKAFTALYGDGSGGSKKAASKGGAAAALAKSKAARAAKSSKEAAEAEELLKEMQAKHAKKTGGKAGEASLEAMIRARAEERSSGMGGFLMGLEEKYGGGAGGKGKSGGRGLLKDSDGGGGGGGGSPPKKSKRK